MQNNTHSRRILIYPPFADPTQPYLALPALKGYLRRRGRDAAVIDLNVEAAHFLLSTGHATRCAERISERFLELNARSSLGLDEQMEYVGLAQARPRMAQWLASGETPIEIFRNASKFYDIGRYTAARNLTEDILACVSAAAYPFRYHFNQASHQVVPWDFDLLDAYCREGQSPLDDFYKDFLAGLDAAGLQFVGLSLTFPSQLPEVFYLARLLKKIAPQCFTMVGGACMHQIVTLAPESTRRKILAAVDAVGLFEGEETLVQLFERLDDGKKLCDPRERYGCAKEIPNLMLLDPVTGNSHVGPLRVLAMDDLPLPDYSDLSLERYLAPEKILLFAPSKGCYWNQCSFCFYGFNTSAAHGYREMNAATAVSQLQTLGRRYGVSHFYISADVLAPAFVANFARELLDRRVSIRWSTDLRVEKHYTFELCDALFRSGLRAVAFGVESGSDRMLRIMRKGIQTALIREVGEHFHATGIATAYMAFTGHPRETIQEALQTVEMIRDQGAAIDLFIVGEFGLTGGCDIAKDPAAYGIKKIFYTAGDEFRMYPLFEPNPASRNGRVRRLDAAVGRVAANFHLDHYPWAGAISTHHSFLYFLRHGQDVFRKRSFWAPKATLAGIKPRPAAWRGLTVKANFPVRHLAKTHRRILSDFLAEALSPGKGQSAPLSFDYFRKHLGLHKDTRSV